jgi:hypothetical protein
MLNCFYSLSLYVTENTVDTELFLQPHLYVTENIADAELFLHLRAYVTDNMAWQPSTYGNEELVTHSYQW